MNQKISKSLPSLVCVDTNIFLGMTGIILKKGQEELVARCQSLLRSLEKQKQRICITSVTLGESLVPFSEVERNSFQIQIQRFIQFPFDSLAAFKFAELRRASLSGALLDAVKKDPAKSRGKHLADLQILAIAIVRRVDILYTLDGWLASLDRSHFGASSLEISQLPSLAELDTHPLLHGVTVLEV